MSDGNAAAKVMYGPLSDAAATLSRHRVSEREDTTGIPGGEREVDASRSIWTSTNLGQLPRRSPSHPRKYAGAHSPDPKAPPPRLGRAMVRTPLDYLQPLLRAHSHSRVGKEEEEKREALPLLPSLSHHFLFSLDSDSASLKWQLGNEGRRAGARVARTRPSFIFPARLHDCERPSLLPCVRRPRKSYRQCWSCPPKCSSWPTKGRRRKPHNAEHVVVSISRPFHSSRVTCTRRSPSSSLIVANWRMPFQLIFPLF